MLKTTLLASTAAALIALGAQGAWIPASAGGISVKTNSMNIKPKVKPKVKPRIRVHKPKVRVRVNTKHLTKQKDESGDSGSGGGKKTADEKQISPSDDTNVANAPLPDRKPQFETADTGGPGLPNSNPLRNRAENLIAALGGPERAQELERLKELQEGGLDARTDAFGSEEDCQKFGDHASIGTDCGGGNTQQDAAPHGGDPRADMVYGPTDPGNTDYPRPDPNDGADSNRQHPDAWIGSGDGTATGDAGIKDFGQGQTSQDSDGSFWDSDSSDGSSDVSSGSSSPLDNDMTFKDFDGDGDIDHSTETETKTVPGKGTIKTVTHFDGDGNKTGTEVHVFSDDGSWATFDNGSWGVAVMNDEGDGRWVVHHPDGTEEQGPINNFSRGEAEQPNPVDTGGGGNGGDCLTLGIRCGVAKNENDTLFGNDMGTFTGYGEPLGDRLTPQKVFEMVGQPVPGPARNGTTDNVEDGSGIAGMTPGCDASPGGCGGQGAAGSGETAMDLDDLGIDTSIAGYTPVDPHDPH